MWNKGKHNVEEINGKRCSIVETGVNENRMKFLKSLLEHNKYTVEVTEEPEKGFKIGVTDMLFNPVIDVYKRRIYTPSGDVVDYYSWNQITK